MPPARATAVVVTYNRLALLRQCLAALLAQTHPLHELIVVDNASTDGTAPAVRAEFPEARLLALETNQGGAGGFHEGLEAATGTDWVWLMDDDTIARPDSLERLLAGLGRVPPGSPPALLASRVDWRDGHPHPMNLPVLARRDLPRLVAACEAGVLPLRAATFVSLLVRREVADRHAGPIKAYFFQNDDVEYTARILRHERGFLIADSVVEHRTAAPATALEDSPFKLYHAIRNTLQSLKGDAWATEEKPVLLWSALSSGARFVWRERSLESARVLWRALRDGVRPLSSP
jgi:GT2 family glycosyltransferase